MRLRAFGNTDLRVTELGLGCARIGGVFQGDTLSFMRLIAMARDSGINFFDTADMYSQGESETLLGNAFRSKREQVVIATKAGYLLPTRRKLAGHLKPILRPVIRALRLRRDRVPASARGKIAAQDFSPRYLVRALEASLRRLRTDYVDLLQLHSPPTEVVERGDWEPALEDLKRAGKVRHYGIACDTLETGLAALRFPGVSSIQFTFSLLEQKASEALLPEAQRRGVAGIAREILGNGLLVKDAGEIDFTKYCSSREELERRPKELADLRREAAARHLPLSQMAMEFASRADGVSVALVGARTPQQLRRLLDDFPS
jgi:aryl-alcohol dehydrogenase-like predicted oxidoreductase